MELPTQIEEEPMSENEAEDYEGLDNPYNEPDIVQDADDVDLDDDVEEGE